MHTPDFLKERLAPGARQTLEPLRRVLERLGQPQRRFPAVGVAGTNGKGSTCLFLQHSLAAAGVKTGLLISPSLHSLRELIRLDGRWLEPAHFRSLCEEVVSVAAPDSLTLFELLVAVAMLAFARAGVEVAIVEAGMGGRLDATRLAEPILTLITTLALDHVAELGGSLESIAWHKAGLAPAGTALLTASSGPGLRALQQVLTAERRLDRLEILGSSFSLTPATGTGTLPRCGEPCELIFRDGSGEVSLGGVRLGPQGLHQWENGALALRAARVLGEQGLVSAARLDRAALRAGLEAPGQPGRLERLCFPDQPELPLWLDGAHNPEGAQRLQESLRCLLGDGPRHLLLAVYADKDVEGMLEALLPGTERLLLVETGQARALPVAALLARAERVAQSIGWGGTLMPMGAVEEGLRALKSSLLAAKECGVSAAGVICGTLSLVAPVYRALGLEGRLCLEDVDSSGDSPPERQALPDASL